MVASWGNHQLLGCCDNFSPSSLIVFKDRIVFTAHNRGNGHTYICASNGSLSGSGVVARLPKSDVYWPLVAEGRLFLYGEDCGQILEYEP